MRAASSARDNKGKRTERLMSTRLQGIKIEVEIDRHRAGIDPGRDNREHRENDFIGHGVAYGLLRLGVEGPEVRTEFELLPGIGAQEGAIEQGPDALGGAQRDAVA